MIGGKVSEQTKVGVHYRQLAFACGPVHPGLTSWDILSRPYGTDRELPES